MDEMTLQRAKKLFLDYHGNHFYMDHDGVLPEYESYHISKETEKMWAEESVQGFRMSEESGKKTLRSYSLVTDLLDCKKRDELKECLYYPFEAARLDDVTVLFMLQVSYRLAERAAKKGCLSKEETEAYIRALNDYSIQVLDRMEKGTLTRADDYIPQDFYDPVYTAGYLKDLREKWEELK